MKAVRELPEDMQAAIAHDLEQQIAAFTQSHLTDEQKSVVAARLGKPQNTVSREMWQATLNRYKLA